MHAHTNADHISKEEEKLTQNILTFFVFFVTIIDLGLHWNGIIWMISAFMMHKTKVVDPICIKAEANELNFFGVESCYDQW